MPTARKIPIDNENFSTYSSSVANNRQSQSVYSAYASTSDNDYTPLARRPIEINVNRSTKSRSDVSPLPDVSPILRVGGGQSVASGVGRSFDELDNDDHESSSIYYGANTNYDGKIAELFESGFSFTKLELGRLLGEGTFNVAQHRVSGFSSLLKHQNEREGNQNMLIQELRTTLKTILEEFELLKSECCRVERKYKETTLQSIYDLRRSMNILFKLQQQTSMLETVTSERDRLLGDKMRLRDRIASKEKERKLTEIEVNEKNRENESLQLEVQRLRDIISNNVRAGLPGRGSSTPPSRNSGSGSGNIENLYERRHTLAKKISSRNNFSEDSKIELTKVTIDTNNTTTTHISLEEFMRSLDYIDSIEKDLEVSKNEIAQLRSQLDSQASGYRSSASYSVNTATSSSDDRNLRLQAERIAEEERRKCMAAEQRLLNAESEWNAASEKVEREMAAYRNKIQESNNKMEQYVQAYRMAMESLQTVTAERDEAYELLRRDGLDIEDANVAAAPPPSSSHYLRTSPLERNQRSGHTTSSNNVNTDRDIETGSGNDEDIYGDDSRF